jgi:hypothetical protein
MTGIAVAIIILVVVVLAVLAIVGRALMRRRHLQQQFGPEYERVVADAGSRREAEQELAERERRHADLPLRALPPDARDRYADQWLAVQEMFVDDPVRSVGEADRLIVAVMAARGYQTDSYQTDGYQPADDRTGEGVRADGVRGDGVRGDGVRGEGAGVDGGQPPQSSADARDEGVPAQGERAGDGYQQQLADLSVQHAGRLPDYRAAHEISGRAAAGTATTEDLRQAMRHYRALFEELLGDRVRTDRGASA